MSSLSQEELLKKKEKDESKPRKKTVGKRNQVKNSALKGVTINAQTSWENPNNLFLPTYCWKKTNDCKTSY